MPATLGWSHVQYYARNHRILLVRTYTRELVTGYVCSSEGHSSITPVYTYSHASPTRKTNNQVPCLNSNVVTTHTAPYRAIYRPGKRT